MNLVRAADDGREIVIFGWVLDRAERVRSLLVTINKGLPTELSETAQYGLPRVDVRSALPHVAHASNCGFRALFRAPDFDLHEIKNIEGTVVLQSGETLTGFFAVPGRKSIEERLAAVELPSKDGKVWGFLDSVSPCYIGEGRKGLVVRGWIAHADKPIVGLTLVGQQSGLSVRSSDVMYGIEKPDVVELLRDTPGGGRVAFRAVFKIADFKTEQPASFRAHVTLDGSREFETAFPPTIVLETMTTLAEGVCLPMHQSGKSVAPSRFCFGNVASIQKVWLGRGRIGYYVAGWLLAPEMQITDVWLETEGRKCEVFHFGYPQHGLEVEYPEEKGSKGWFSGLLAGQKWHRTELICRITGRAENGDEFFCDLPTQPVDCGFYHPVAEQASAVPGKNIGIYQCCYSDQSKERLDPGFIPYFNDRSSRFFENDVIVDLVRSGKHSAWDYFGVFSWRFSEKVPLRSEMIFDLMNEDRYGADVYSFFEGIHSGLGEAGFNTWTCGEFSHPGLIQAGEVLLRRLGMRVDLRRLSAPIIYQNHFICRSELYERYVRELLEPAIGMMSDVNDREIQELVGGDSQYITRSNTATLVFGRPYFSLEPFICERLFNIWAALQSLKVRHIFCAKIPGG